VATDDDGATKTSLLGIPGQPRPPYHHHHQQQQQQGMIADDCRSSSSQVMLRTVDRVALTERVWNLGRVMLSAAVHALRYSSDGVLYVYWVQFT